MHWREDLILPFTSRPIAAGACSRWRYATMERASPKKNSAKYSCPFSRPERKVPVLDSAFPNKSYHSMAAPSRCVRGKVRAPPFTLSSITPRGSLSNLSTHRPRLCLPFYIDVILQFLSDERPMKEVIVIAVVATTVIVRQRHVLVYRAGNRNHFVPVLQCVLEVIDGFVPGALVAGKAICLKVHGTLNF